MAGPFDGRTASRPSRGRTATLAAPSGVSRPTFLFNDAPPSQDDLYSPPRRQSENTAGSPRRLPDLPSHPGWMPQERPVFAPKYAPRPSPNGSAGELCQPPPQMAIGMALGSPSHSPWATASLPATGSTSAQSFLATTPSGLFSAVPYEPSVSPTPDEAAKKGGWKLFGGLFSRKGSSPMAGQGEVPYGDFTSGQEEPSLQQPRTLRPRHGRSASRSLDLGTVRNLSSTNNGTTSGLRSKPSIPRIQTGSASKSKRSSPIPPPKDTPRLLMRSPPGPPQLLELDIPDVSMERYSVMFGNVLNHRQSTLMARRQAKMDRLKMLEGFEEEPEESGNLRTPIRRSTLPSPAKPSYSSYSLFPPAADGKVPPRSSSRSPAALQRSATAPTISPARPEFATSRSFTTAQDYHEHVSDDQSPLTSEASPETPEDPVWCPGMSLKQPDLGMLEEQSIDPRYQDTGIVIRFQEQPPQHPKVRMDPPREISRGPRLINITHSPNNSRNLQSSGPFSKNNSPVTSPQHQRLASLNKPLPSPLNRSRVVEPNPEVYSPRKPSLQLQSKYSPQVRETRNASLPTPPMVVLERPAEKRLETAPAPARAQEQPQRGLREKRSQAQLPPIRTREQSPSASRLQTSQAPPTKEHITVKYTRPSPVDVSPASPATRAEISIARQISISRRQHMMVPIVAKTVKQPQQATLVQVPNSPSQMEERRKQASRKSHHILLETA